jgi:hypothetical protein
LLRGRRPRLVLVGGVAALAIVALATVFSLSRNAGARRLTRPQAFGSRLQASISSPLPSCCAFGFDGVWAVGHHDETLEKIDPTTNRIVGRYRVRASRPSSRWRRLGRSGFRRPAGTSCASILRAGGCWPGSP